MRISGEIQNLIAASVMSTICFIPNPFWHQRKIHGFFFQNLLPPYSTGHNQSILYGVCACISLRTIHEAITHSSRLIKVANIPRAYPSHPTSRGSTFCSCSPLGVTSFPSSNQLSSLPSSWSRSNFNSTHGPIFSLKFVSHASKGGLVMTGSTLA